MFFAVLVAVAAGVAASFYTDYLRFADAPLAPLAEGVSINVPLGTSLPGTVRLLDDATGAEAGRGYLELTGYWRPMKL